jgi:parvulin-like peptidyl-prolyl isomerase
MRKRIGLLVLVALVLGGCGNLLQPAAATVGDTKITIHEVEKALDEYERSDEFEEGSQQGDPQALRRAFEQQELSRLILIAVLEPEAEGLGLDVSDDEVQAEIDRVIEEDYGGNEARFQEILKEQGIPESEVPDIAYLRLLERRVRNAVTEDLTPSEEELRSFYEDNAQRFVETQASEIVLPSRGDAERVANVLRLSPADELEDHFARIAREESLNSETAVSGGALPVPFKPGEVDPAFEATAARLTPGTTSGPIQTDQGWEVIMVTDRQAIPFEEVRDDIVEALAGEERDEVWRKWLEDAYEAAEVEVNPRFGELDIETLTVVDAPTSDLPGTEDVAPAEEPAPEAGG